MYAFVQKYKKAVLGSIPLAFGLAAVWGFQDAALEVQVTQTVLAVVALIGVVAGTNREV